MSTGAAITAVVCGTLGLACTWWARSLDRDRDSVEATPHFHSIDSLTTFLRDASDVPGGPGTRAAFVGFDGLSATPAVPAAGDFDGRDGAALIVRDCEVVEVSEHYSWHATPVPESAPGGAPAPSSSSSSPPGEWVREERERVVTSRPNHREIHALQLTDGSSSGSGNTQQKRVITVHPYSLLHLHPDLVVCHLHPMIDQ